MKRNTLNLTIEIPEEVRGRLGLNNDVPGDTRLSDLRRQRGWTMHEIREAVSQP